MTEPSEHIQQMSIGIDGRDELVIMIMHDSLQRICLQHKRFGTSPHHVEKCAPTCEACSFTAPAPPCERRQTKPISTIYG